MADPLLFVPGYGMSPRRCEDVPALRATLDDLREHFQVTVFHWPTVYGGPAVPLTWQAAVDIMRDALPEGGHVVAIRGSITYVLLALAAGDNNLRSLVFDGMDIPPATWAALGMKTRADAAAAALNIDISAVSGPRLLFPEADEDVADELIAHLYSDATWSDAKQFVDDARNINLLRECRPSSRPALYIQRDPLIFWREDHDLVSRFLPNTTLVEDGPWRFQDAESGHTFADQAIAFMQEHRAKPHQPSSSPGA
jgi:hypothetical protein